MEGCGIAHWATVDDWDGTTAAITELGGARHQLDADALAVTLAGYVTVHPGTDADSIDGYVADEIVQTALFGQVIYL